MKIYPSDHKIKVSTESHIDTDLNIPLAYINVDYTKYDITHQVSAGFTNSSKRTIAPGEAFDRPDIKVFNEFEEELDTEGLFSRQGDKYIYNPTESMSFDPLTFLYKATIKKNMFYNISSSYNMTIGCVDDPDSLDLSNRLAEVFTNPSQRNIVPPNISINNNKMTQHSFTNQSLNDCDFVFIESPDGVNYTEEESPIDFDSFLNYNANVWLGCEDHPKYKYENFGHLVDFVINNPIVSANTVIQSDIYFDINAIDVPETINIHNPFTTNLVPILIMEHIGKGFMIISHSEVLKNMGQNAAVMYEMLMYVYLRTYKSTPKVKEWITNVMPEFEIQNGYLRRKNNFISNFDLSRYFGLKASEMQVFEVGIMDDPDYKKPQNNYDLQNDLAGIKYIGISNNRVMFEKDKTSFTYSGEPEKPFGWKSIYDGTKVLYVPNLHYLVESSLSDRIFTTESDVDLKVKVLPFKSSINAINMQYPTDFTIPFVIAKNDYIERVREGTFVVYIKNNKIDFCYEEDFKNIEQALELFTIKVKQTPEAVKINDMRQLGGGLPEDMPDNYNLLDIGHINGRPYRAAGTLVITMPKKYEPYKDKIMAAIHKYKNAEEYPVIFFEDKED